MRFTFLAQTGAASLTALNAQAALEAASYLQLPDMVEAVVAFIVPSISLVRALAFCVAAGRSTVAPSVLSL